MTAARKKQAPVAEELFPTPSEEELQRRHLEALEIVADWKEELQRRQKRLLLRSEMIGGVTDEEVEELRQDFKRLEQCMRVLSWRVE
jgi:predicted CopG family antitoxin